MDIKDKALFRQEAYVNGQWINTAGQVEVLNPFNGEVIGGVPDMGASETSSAIEAAHSAFEAWRKKTATERSRILRKWFELQREHAEDLAMILTMEQGKPLSEALGEIKYGASFVEWFSEEAKRAYGDVIPSHQADKRIVTIKQPIGVVAAITPWNFPNAMITRKVAPALAAGCTVVVKPAKATPFSALALAELADRAGIPAGVLNIVTGNSARAIGEILCADPLVRKLSFTGSTAVGKTLIKQCADTVKKVSMELGGNAPFIVFDDADMDAAVKGAMASKFRNTGQTCICSNRFFVHSSVHDEFVRKLEAAMKKLKLGNGLESGTKIGPMINEETVEFVERLIEESVADGARVKLGGKRVSDRSLIYEPSLLLNVQDTMRIHREEIFGPIVPVYKFEDEQEVIRKANNTEYGLAAYFYGRDMGRVWRVAEELEYGMVGINTGLISTTLAPFGGVKESGYGREGSKYGMDEFMELKYLCFGGI